jgi:hypothetical protein
MKQKINQFLNWFEEKFNFIIELLAFLGGIFCLLFAVFIFILMVFQVEWVSEITLAIIILPGVIGFSGVIILFALRITRFMTQKR